MAPLITPNWIHRHLLKETFPEEMSSERLSAIRKGLARYKDVRPKVSIVIPAYNEEKYLLKTLSSLSELKLPDEIATELFVVNDASTDQTSQILDSMGVKELLLPVNMRPKGARQQGLEAAQGDIILQADADTLYREDWGLSYLNGLEDSSTSLVYGSHSFVSEYGRSRMSFCFHETLGEILYAIRRRKRAYINVHGFNSAFRRRDGLEYGSYEHTPTGSEDGHMALMLMKIGRLKYLRSADARAWTSDRRLQADGGLKWAFAKRLQKEGARLGEYLSP